MDKECARNILAGILTLTGTAKTVALVLGSTSLFLAAQSFAAAPLPLPFRAQPGGYEGFASYREYTVTFADGSYSLFNDADFAKSLSGPHRRKIVLLQAAQLLPVLRKSTSHSILEHAFCSDTPPFHTVVQEKEVRELAIKTKVTTAGQEHREWNDTIVCP